MIIGVIKRQLFPHVFDNSDLSQEIFVIDTWGAVICFLGHGRKQAHAYDPSDNMETRLKVRISDLEIKLRKLDAEKSSLQSQVNKLNRLNNEQKTAS